MCGCLFAIAFCLCAFISLLFYFQRCQTFVCLLLFAVVIGYCFIYLQSLFVCYAGGRVNVWLSICNRFLFVCVPLLFLSGVCEECVFFL